MGGRGRVVWEGWGGGIASELREDVLRGTTSRSLVPCLAVKGTNLMISRGGDGGGGGGGGAMG